jgi:hypothetical protein
MKQFNDNLLKRMGGSHITLIIAISQIIGLLGVIPGFVSLQLIADFGEELTHHPIVFISVTHLDYCQPDYIIEYKLVKHTYSKSTIISLEQRL